MKKITLLIAIFLFCLNSESQVPPGFSYQAIVRNDAGEPLSLKSVNFRFTILISSIEGTEIYVETQSTITNAFGLASLTVGRGTAVKGEFDPGGWGLDDHYLKIEIDPEGGESFKLLGTQQLQSVPYAFHAQTVAEDKVKDDDADPTNELQDLHISGTVLSLSGSTKTVTLPSSGEGGDNWGTQTVVSDESINGEGTSANPLGVDLSKIQPSWLTIQEMPDDFADGIDDVNDADPDATNELQTLSKEGNVVSLSKNGGSFTDEVEDADADITNELQLLTKSGNVISLSDGGGSVTDEVDDADADITNELQTLTKSGNIITLSAGGGSVVDEIEDGDSDSSNELQKLTKTENTLSLSDGGGSVTLELDEVDGDITNELQTLAKSGSTITLSNGGGSVTDDVNDSDADPNNEFQTLSLSGSNLTLSDGGGTVLLPGSTSGDNWGTQVVESNSTLSGDGTSGNPLAVVGDLTDNQTLSISGNDLTISDGNTVALPEASTGLWSASGSDVYRSTGRVGIGTSTPVNNIHVRTSTRFSGISFTNDASGNTSEDGLVIGSSYQAGEPAYCYSIIDNKENSTLIFSTNGFAKMYLTSDGRLGIGNYPNTTLDINGQIKIRGGTPGTGRVLTSDGFGLATWEIPDYGMILPFSAVGTCNTESAFTITNTGENNAIRAYAANASGSTNGVYSVNASNRGTGVYGYCSNTSGNTVGIYGHVTSSEGVAVKGNATSGSGNTYGILGYNVSSEGIGVSGISASTSGSCIGVKGATNSSSGYSGYFEGGKFYIYGKTGIGTFNPDYMLDVYGNSRIRISRSGGDWIAMRTDGTLLDFSFGGESLVIRGTEDGEDILLNPAINSKVGIRMWIPQYDLDVNGNIRATGSVYYGGSTTAADGKPYSKPDYVFKENYKILTTLEVEEFLKKEKHLPWITSAEKEKEENGDVVDMTRMAFETVETIENLQLQIIELNQQLQEMKQLIHKQQKELIQLKNQKLKK